MSIVEKTWEFNCDLVFNHKVIRKITITDHFMIKHSDILVENVVNQIDGLSIDPTSYVGVRDVFRLKTFYRGKKYRLIFWFKDEANDHLWIRNCHRVI